MPGTTTAGTDARFANLLEPIRDSALLEQVVSRAHRVGATQSVRVATLQAFVAGSKPTKSAEASAYSFTPTSLPPRTSGSSRPPTSPRAGASCQSDPVSPRRMRPGEAPGTERAHAPTQSVATAAWTAAAHAASAGE